MLVHHNINLNDYQLQNAKVHVTGVAPATEKGQIYLDSGDNFLKYHNGTTWVELRNDFLNSGDNISELINDAGYLTSFTEADPIFLAHVAASILASDITNWNTAYSWGDHSLAGYLTSFSETDTLDSVTSRNPVTANNIQVGSLVVSGNLTVSGTTTTINTEEINLADNIITLNSNATGPATENAGLMIERGSDANRGFRWNETTNTWQIQKDDSIYYDISVVDPTGKIYSQTINDTNSITHNLNTRDISIEMYDTVTFEVYHAKWVATTTNIVDVTFYQTPTNPIRVIITKQA